MGDIIVSPEYTITHDKRSIVIGVDQEFHPMIVLDNRFIDNTAVIIEIKTEEDFNHLWDCIEREFSDQAPDPAYWDGN